MRSKNDKLKNFMGLFKRNPFGHILFLKKWLIRIFGAITHRRYRGFNELQIEGSDIIKNLPETNVPKILEELLKNYPGVDKVVSTENQ